MVHILVVTVCSIILLNVPISRGEARCRPAFFFFFPLSLSFLMLECHHVECLRNCSSVQSLSRVGFCYPMNRSTCQAPSPSLTPGAPGDGCPSPHTKSSPVESRVPSTAKEGVRTRGLPGLHWAWSCSLPRAVWSPLSGSTPSAGHGGVPSLRY